MQEGKYRVVFFSSAAVGISTVYYIIRPLLVPAHSVLNHTGLYVSIHYHLLSIIQSNKAKERITAVCHCQRLLRKFSAA